MTRRYFAANLPPTGGVVSLDEAESHHAIKVMRLKVGESITLFDGIGNEASAEIESQTRRDVICKTHPPAAVNRENSTAITLGVAMPKGDRSKELVERLCELGVYRLVPLHCERTQWPVSENTIQKWHRVIIDACKQSGRNHLMKIANPIIAKDWFAQASETENVQCVIAHPGGEPLEPLATQATTCLAIRAAIGPEGGFTDDEIDIANQHQWQTHTLGPRIYRIETAAIVMTIKLSR